MTPLLRSALPVLCSALLFTLTAPAQNAPPAQPGPPGAAGRPAPPPYVPKNLKILPDNTDLRTVMRGFEGALGVECEFCHTANRQDRASDANPMKDKARAMIKMTMDLNEKYLAEMPDRHPDVSVTCGTCHRGSKLPTAFVPPPRQQGPGGPPPAGAPPAPPK